MSQTRMRTRQPRAGAEVEALPTRPTPKAKRWKDRLAELTPEQQAWHARQQMLKATPIAELDTSRLKPHERTWLERRKARAAAAAKASKKSEGKSETKSQGGSASHGQGGSAGEGGKHK